MNRPSAPTGPNRVVFTRFVVTALSLTLMSSALVGCSKKKKEPTAEATAAGKPAKGALAKAAGALKAKAASAKAAGGAVAKAASKLVAGPAPKDVALTEDAGVVAWLTIKSIGAAFDVGEVIAGKMGVVPPGASLRESAYRDLTTMLASQGVSGHEWLDKTKPLHVAMQDDDKSNPQGGLVILLPVTAQKKALSAFASAKTGTEAKGHAALMQVGAQTLYLDFIDGYLVLTAAEGRFKKITSFAKRISKLTPPALVYLGVSVREAAKTREAEIKALMSQLERMSKRQGVAKGMAASSDYYNKTLREWLVDLQRFELLINASGDNVELGWRMHAKAGSRLARQMLAGKGRDASDLAGTLPGNSYLAFVGDMDPSAAMDQLGDSLRVMKEAFKLDDATMAQVKADLLSTVKLQTGRSFAAAYPDGDAALGFVLGAGANDPHAMLKVVRKLTSVIALRIIEMEEAKAKKRDPKRPSDPKMAIVKRAIKEMRITPLIEAFGPVAKEAGLTVTANTSKDGGITCDVVDLTMDWAKLAKSGGGRDAERAAKVIGPRTALALCAGGKRVVIAGGPSALEQGRRATAAKPGGLAAAPVFKGALKRSIAHPAWFMYLNAGAAVKAFEKVLPRPIALPADRAVSFGCGNRERSFSCELDVPVELIKAVVALSKSNRRAP